MSLETLTNRQAEQILALAGRIKELERIPDLAAKIGRDDGAATEAEDAFAGVAFQLLGGEFSDFLADAATPVGDYRRWEWAAAYLLHLGQACLTAHETHPLGLDELTAKHGGDVVARFDPLEDGTVELDGVRYEEHPRLPCWREVGCETCEAHGLPLRDSVDFDTGESLRQCVRCFREGVHGA